MFLTYQNPPTINAIPARDQRARRGPGSAVGLRRKLQAATRMPGSANPYVGLMPRPKPAAIRSRAGGTPHAARLKVATTSAEAGVSFRQEVALMWSTGTVL